MRPSALLATNSTGCLAAKHWAKCSSAGDTGACIQHEQHQIAWLTALAELVRMRPARVSGADSSRPAVSIRRPCGRATGLGVLAVARHAGRVGDKRDTRRRGVDKVDLPTLGRPAMTTIGSVGGNMGVTQRDQARVVGENQDGTIGDHGSRRGGRSDNAIWPRISPV